MIKQRLFGTLESGQNVRVFTLSNTTGMQIEILDLGAIIRSWRVPSSKGDNSHTGQSDTDIVLGFDTLDDYLTSQAYFGAVVGRYANRIAKGQFSLGEDRYQVSTNQDAHCLHGGHDGFNQRIWQAQCIDSDSAPSLTLSLISEDGDQGFPGRLSTSVTYTLDEQGLTIVYRATSNKDTVFNPTQHSYFNLAGHDSGSIKQHQVQILANRYTPTNEDGIPTGALADVANSPFDLTQLTSLEGPLLSAHPQVKQANGFDHNWCLDNYQQQMSAPALAAKAREPKSGRTLTVLTTMPGLQLYTANQLEAEPVGKSETIYKGHHAFCFETQCYPDSPNQAHFPSATLKANVNYQSTTQYCLSYS